MSSPFSNKTPESYFAGLRRKDSKNALTTCHGVTDKGRACRRALASPKNSSKFDGAVVITGNADDPAVFFCWQHKDQADAMLQGEDEGSVVSIKGRHSLEDAFRSLGLDDVDEEPEPRESPSPHRSPGLSPHIRIPEPLQTVANESEKSSPAFHEPLDVADRSNERQRNRRRRSDVRDGTTTTKPRHRRTEAQRPEPRKSSFSLLSCCFGDGSGSRDDQHTRGDRPVAKPSPQAPRPVLYSPSRTAPLRPVASEKYARSKYDPSTPSGDVRRKEVPSHRKTDSGFALGTDRHRQDSRQSFETRGNTRPDALSGSHSNIRVYRDSSPSPAPRLSSHQPKYTSLLDVSVDRPLNARSKSTPDSQQLYRTHGEWPPPLPRDATDSVRICYAKLLTAMSEAPSKTDSPGYIYIFWQTDVQQTSDETSAVASIISAPRLDRGIHRQETILQKRFFQTSANARLPRTLEKRTIFLKIGRAVNVHQRLVQWKKQCEYEISLLRSYPHERSVPAPVPNVVKVERLIHLHLEMQGQRVKKECRCGTEHKEWFEVEANARAVREVDEIVRGWVRWSEQRFGQEI